VALFVTLEGIEGCGKTTHAARLAEHLRAAGHEVVVTREPGGTDVTMQIRALLADPDIALDARAELFLFLADRAQHVAEVIRPALARGAVVLCDRYSDSTMAYQGYGRGHDLTLLRSWNDWAARATVPDLTVWIDTDLATGLARARKHSGLAEGDRFEAESLDFHGKIRAGFAEMAANEPRRIVRVDGNRRIDVVGADILALVLERLAERDDTVVTHEHQSARRNAHFDRPDNEREENSRPRSRR
jgi:dTMP kinase